MNISVLVSPSVTSVSRIFFFRSPPSPIPPRIGMPDTAPFGVVRNVPPVPAFMA